MQQKWSIRKTVATKKKLRDEQGGKKTELKNEIKSEKHVSIVTCWGIQFSLHTTAPAIWDAVKTSERSIHPYILTQHPFCALAFSSGLFFFLSTLAHTPNICAFYVMQYIHITFSVRCAHFSLRTIHNRYIYKCWYHLCYYHSPTVPSSFLTMLFFFVPFFLARTIDLSLYSHIMARVTNRSVYVGGLSQIEKMCIFFFIHRRIDMCI